MKYLLLIIMATLLLGCEPETTDISNGYVMPKELAGCKALSMKGSPKNLYVVVCPGFTTTNWETTQVHSSGKTTYTTTEDHSATVRNAEEQ